MLFGLKTPVSGFLRFILLSNLRWFYSIVEKRVGGKPENGLAVG
jgi:hypothetical protein